MTKLLEMWIDSDFSNLDRGNKNHIKVLLFDIGIIEYLVINRITLRIEKKSISCKFSLEITISKKSENSVRFDDLVFTFELLVN